MMTVKYIGVFLLFFSPSYQSTTVGRCYECDGTKVLTCNHPYFALEEFKQDCPLTQCCIAQVFIGDRNFQVRRCGSLNCSAYRAISEECTQTCCQQELCNMSTSPEEVFWIKWMFVFIAVVDKV